MCRDVGDSTYVTLSTDLAGNDRVQGGDTCQVDIGAYEYQAGDCGGAGCTLPTANFGGTPLSGNETLTVSFTDSSTATPTSWKWYFGDGDSSTVQNPSHDYTAGGTYSVQLIATNACGSDTLTRTDYITVNNTGACCAVNYTCSVTDSVTCVTAGSEWQGNDVACSPDPCAETVGSCCLPNNVCIVQVEIGCLGTWTSGATCDPGDCGFRGTCDYTLTEADLPYSATNPGTYCLDTGADQVYEWDGSAGQIFQVSSTTGIAELVPFNGWFQDTLRIIGDGNSGRAIKAFSPSGLTLKGWIIDGDTFSNDLIWTQTDSVTVDSCVVNGGFSIGPNTADTTNVAYDGPDGITIKDVEFRPAGTINSGILAIAGRGTTQYGDCADTTDVVVAGWADNITLQNVYFDIPSINSSNENYPIYAYGWKNFSVDGLTIHATGTSSTASDITLVQVLGCQDGYFDDVNLYAYTGVERLMTVRVTKDICTEASTKSKRVRVSNLFGYSGFGNGLTIGQDSSQVYNVELYAPGDYGSQANVFRFDESARADTVENVLAVATSDAGIALYFNGADHFAGGRFRISNFTGVAHGTRTTTGKGVCLYWPNNGAGPDSVWLNNSVFVQTDPNAPLFITRNGVAPDYFAFEENALDGGNNLWETNSGTTFIADLTALGTTYPEATDNLWNPAGSGTEPILGNATTQDTTGSYGLHYLSPALDIGDSTLPVLGRTTDLAGYDRVVSTNMDPGAYEFQFDGLIGACCLPDGSCQEVLSEDCTALSGTFQGTGTDCNPNPCSAPTGACCVNDTTCTVETEADCTTLTGTWYQGETCAGIDCEAYGACCTGTGCWVVSASVCSSVGGTFWGDGTDCDPDPCASATGACCTAYGCYVIDPTECETDSLGTYMGNGVQCTPDPCTGTTGACCYFWTGQCQVITEADCTTQGGDYQGNGTDCNPNPCPAPMGACCTNSGSCSVTTEAGCTGVEWNYATPCFPDPCPDYTVGACCLPDIEIDWPCVVTTQTACATFEGAFQGNGTTCSPDPCTGYGLARGARFMEIDAATTWMQKNAPTTNHSADSVDQVTGYTTPTSTILWRFDLPNPGVGTVTDAWIEGTLNSSTGGGPWPLEMYRVIPDVVISEATWNEYSSGNSWDGAGATTVGTDIALPQLAFEDLPGSTAPGDRIRLVGGYRARHLVKKFLVPDGTVTVLMRAPQQGYTLTWKGDGTADPPTLTIVYTLDGRRRTLQILGQ